MVALVAGTALKVQNLIIYALDGSKILILLYALGGLKKSLLGKFTPDWKLSVKIYNLEANVFASLTLTGAFVVLNPILRLPQWCIVSLSTSTTQLILSHIYFALALPPLSSALRIWNCTFNLCCSSSLEWTSKRPPLCLFLPVKVRLLSAACHVSWKVYSQMKAA